LVNIIKVTGNNIEGHQLSQGCAYGCA